MFLNSLLLQSVMRYSILTVGIFGSKLNQSKFFDLTMIRVVFDLIEFAPPRWGVFVRSIEPRARQQPHGAVVEARVYPITIKLDFV